MIKAYHWVPQRAFPEIARVGHLTPAIERLDRGVFHDKCDEMLESLGSTLRERPVNVFAQQALQSLIEGRLAEFAARPSAGREPFTQLGCIDLLAMDAENVFLQVGRPPDWSDERFSGFVFDAEELVRRGATFRRKDLAPAYWAALQKFMAMPFQDSDHALDELVETFVRVQKANDLRGVPGLRALRGKHGRQPPELLWQGRLPIDLAVESFHANTYLEA
jgi:hypothetical protein